MEICYQTNRRRITQVKVAVITGSTRGIGYALAEALLERGCRVVVSGRHEDSVLSTVERLTMQFGRSEVQGLACDVRDEASLQALWDHSVDCFEKVDIWVNNAGVSNHPEKVWEIASDEIRSVVDTNILGSVLGTKIAVGAMLQQGHGAIYLMEGMGSDGRMHDGLALYGMTKYALDYFFQAISEELEDTAVIIGAIRPGMVVTDLITEPYRGRPEDWARVKPIFNIIADPVGPVCEWMAEAILRNDQNGKTLSRLSRSAMFLRFLKAPFTKRDLFKDVDLSL
jgi:NAD(P)-dependent dehydrogenase (short-subunit alcohol dehydrogenase family)